MAPHFAFRLVNSCLERTTMKALLISATVAVALAVASAANAAVILTFGQSGNGSTITATNGLSSTHIAGTAVPVTISQIAAVTVTPTSAFLTLSADNIGIATT